MSRKSALLIALGVAVGFVLGIVAPAQQEAYAAARNQYKVERIEGMQAGDPAALQEMLDQRAAEGWFLQALDHGTVVFRRGGSAAAVKPTPPPEQ